VSELPRCASIAQPTKGCNIAVPKNPPVLTTLVAMPDKACGLTSLAHDQVKVKPDAPIPITKNKA